MTPHRFITAAAVVVCTIDGESVELPVFPGILKHPTVRELTELLTDPLVARKYTREALRKAPWNALRSFPKSWLVECLRHAELPEGRRRALEFMLA